MGKRFLFVMLAGMFLISISARVSAQSEGRIGYVDLSVAFDEYQKTKDFDNKLEEKGDIKQKERQKLVKEIRKMRDELELMNKTAKERKQQDIDSRIRSLQEFDQKTKTELTKERDDIVRDILKEMNNVIQEYGESHGYSIILNERVLLFGEKSMDLTGEIIKILNDRYKK